jgi:hypothetical protein
MNGRKCANAMIRIHRLFVSVKWALNMPARSPLVTDNSLSPSQRRRVLLNIRKQASREFVRAVRSVTECVRCGSSKTVDFHRVEHEDHFTWRVAWLAAQGASIQRIQQEIAACVALCRRCHMVEDGRLAAFLKTRQLRTPAPPKPCSVCSRLYKPLRRGMCVSCYPNGKYVRRYTSDELRIVHSLRASSRGRCNGRFVQREQNAKYAAQVPERRGQ